LADYLVRKGMPFRDAHETVGKIVVHAIEQSREIQDLPLANLRYFSDLIDDDVFNALSLESTLAAKSRVGGTAPAQVEQALIAARASLGGVE